METRSGNVRGHVGRLGFSGEIGYEILVPAADAPAARKLALEAGRDLGIAECSFEAADSLRIESGYVLFGREITTRETPLELDLARLVDLDGREFIGRKAYMTLRSSPPARCLVGFEILTRTGSPFLPLARVTSECDSPIFNRRIGLGFASSDAAIGSNVRLPDGRLCTIARMPFYDPSRRLPRAAPL